MPTDMFTCRTRRDGRKYGFAGGGFRQVGGKACFMAPLDVFPLSIPAKRDGGKRVPPLAQLAYQVITASVRQAKIADEQVEAVLTGELQGRGHVAGRFNRVALRG